MAIIQVDFRSECLMRTVSLSAIVPTDKPDATGPYKTLYLLHGMSGNHLDWLSMTRIRALAMEHNIAVIMPAGENKFYVDNEASGDMFGEYIGKELVEFTRRLFPLSLKRDDTFIAGLSMGGYGALRNGLKYSETFGCIAALSAARLNAEQLINARDDDPTLSVSKEFYKSIFGGFDKLMGSDKDLEALAMRLKEQSATIPQLYLACGSEDIFVDQNRNFKKFLDEKGIEATYEEGPGGHTWEFWDSYIQRALGHLLL